MASEELHPYIAQIESGQAHNFQDAIRQPPTEKESLADRIARMQKVDMRTVISDAYSWIDQVVLVALGRKPIAVTHFDVAEDWDMEAEDWCVEQRGVNSFVVMEMPPDIKVSTVQVPLFGYENINGGITERLVVPELQVGSIIWFRQDTRKLALLARHFGRLHQKGKDWIFPYYDIIQGLIYGYPRDIVADFAIKQSNGAITKDNIDQYMKAADTYIDEKLKEFA